MLDTIMINSSTTEFQNDTESGCSFHMRIWSPYLYSLLRSTRTLFISALMLYPYIVYLCTDVLSLSGRFSHLEAVPVILVYNYLLSTCHFRASYISYNMGNWGKWMDCGTFLVGEAGWFCKVFKWMHLFVLIFVVWIFIYMLYPWVQLSVYASSAGNIWKI
jgi:hypothetical protein